MNGRYTLQTVLWAAIWAMHKICVFPCAFQDLEVISVVFLYTKSNWIAGQD